jgi:hypothetical protein
MRKLLLWAALGVTAGGLVWACGSDVETETGATTTTSSAGGAGAQGGGGSAPTSTSAGGNGGTGGTGVGGFANHCREACYKIEVECGFTGACSALPGGCGSPEGECVADCVLPEDCFTIASLATNNPDPELCGCVQGCLGMNPCFQCAACACGPQLQACGNDMECQAYLQCAQACADAACVQQCEADHGGMTTDDLVQCLGMDCPICLQGGQGGAGGGGGAGGAGGA